MARLSKDEWASARINYEKEGFSLSKIALKYNIHRANVMRRAKRDGWIECKSFENNNFISFDDAVERIQNGKMLNLSSGKSINSEKVELMAYIKKRIEHCRTYDYNIRVSDVESIINIAFMFDDEYRSFVEEIYDDNDFILTLSQELVS